jgi:WD40 repeat protein
LAAPGEAGEDGADQELEPAWLYRGQISGHSDHVQCLCTHGWREPLAASGGKDDAILFWDVERGEATRRLDLDRSPLDLTFGLGASDAFVFAALDSVHRESGQAVGFDVETGRRLFSTPSPAAGHVSCIHCTADGGTLLAGAAGGSVRLLGARDGAVAFQFETGMPDVNVVSVSCDGRYIQVGAEGWKRGMYGLEGGV